MRNIFFAFLFFFTLVSPVAAELHVVATLPWIGSLAREIGREQVVVTTLVKPNQDPHMVEAKPSMILAGRKADIIMYNGLDLEIGYLPLLLESSRNPRLMPGKPGNFDCSRFVTVIDKPTVVDRSMGDVHPLGNPHYHFSPANILRVAEGMSQTLALLDAANADFYRQNFQGFAARLADHQQRWATIRLQGKRFVAYHKLFEYLAADFGLQITGYVEAKPGIPPSAAHVEGLVAAMQSNAPDALLTTGFYGGKEAESISARTGVKVITLPADVGALAGTDDWIAFMDQTLTLLQ